MRCAKRKEDVIKSILAVYFALFYAFPLAAASAPATVTRRDKFFDTACMGRDSVRVAGTFGKVLGLSPGESWSEVLPALPSIYSLSFHGNNGWAAGTLGGIFYSQDAGRRWSQLPAPTEEALFGIQFLDDRTGFLVGNFGTALRTDDAGLHWKALTLPFPEEYQDPSLNSIFFIDPSRGWIIGEFGLIFHTKNGGRTWRRQNSGVNFSLFKILFQDSMTGYAVGMNGVLLYTDNGGKKWKTLLTQTANHLLTLGLHKGKFWVGGANGILMKVDREKVKRVPMEITSGISSISFCEDQTGFIAGNQGTILSSKDGGETWRQALP